MGLRPSFSALWMVVIATADPPSEIWLAFPAVTVPSLVNAGRSLARASTVVSGRTPSSFVMFCFCFASSA